MIYSHITIHLNEGKLSDKRLYLGGRLVYGMETLPCIKGANPGFIGGSEFSRGRELGKAGACPLKTSSNNLYICTKTAFVSIKSS